VRKKLKIFQKDPGVEGPAFRQKILGGKVLSFPFKLGGFRNDTPDCKLKKQKKRRDEQEKERISKTKKDRRETIEEDSFGGGRNFLGV